MKQFLIFSIFSCFVLMARAQEKIARDSISAVKPPVELSGFSIEKPSMADISLPKFGEAPRPSLSIFTMPLFPDHSKTFDFSKYLSNRSLTTESFIVNGSFWSPFLLNGMTFNQASYQLNNRFTFGGSSFGAQSIFDAPKLNQNIQNMSIKGASMFMQYKVSDHFKIETRVSVANHSSPWEP